MVWISEKIQRPLRPCRLETHQQDLLGPTQHSALTATASALPGLCDAAQWLSSKQSCARKGTGK